MPSGSTSLRRIAQRSISVSSRCPRQAYASLATAASSSRSYDPTLDSSIPQAPRHLPTQPPSFKPPEFRKSQLLRQYISLLKSSQVVLLFQHNNLKASEWAAIRRELAAALLATDKDAASISPDTPPATTADSIRFNVTKTHILEIALQLLEYYKPPQLSSSTSTSAPTTLAGEEPAYTHYLSEYAQRSIRKTPPHPLKPLMSGPIALLSFPSVSPDHLASALRILSPDKQFPAPRKRINPDYHEPAVQSGLQKLILLGARVQETPESQERRDARFLDNWGIRWIAGLNGLGGLRGELAALLNYSGMGLVGALEANSLNLWRTMEGRKQMLEDGEKGEKSE
ncbi:hypothetical protein P152DRAFT_453709 [Eremomyces bilateralis CBS 781.70]|uniref:Uncharacterized protein n=1 Tax=Eremomyces bilateralis CBS 781.70 TaxID=1392243 RepID=A0A6G1GGS0_9PEZI|nr:uncharacterized protein P152DRAFT_453709 [Eremomyces bilateralis CBS 781.70]KAF1817101.1 hypothetical protein P152DRAFT_453709 [Eremomyces bilateralis CBS 781.70]